MNGVLEHFDEPWNNIEFIIDNLLEDDGVLVSTSPSFLNPRGYIWMTLQLLFDVPMSLSDLHFLCPFDFQEFCQKNNLNLQLESTDQDWGAGERTIIDLEKRLKNALKDANMNNNNVEKLLD